MHLTRPIGEMHQGDQPVFGAFGELEHGVGEGLPWITHQFGVELIPKHARRPQQSWARASLCQILDPYRHLGYPSGGQTYRWR